MPAGPIRALRFVHTALLQETAALAERAAALTSPEQAETLSDDVHLATRVLRGHAKGEDEGYLPALDERFPGSSAPFTMDHAHEAPRLDALDALVDAVDSAQRLSELQRALAILAAEVALHQHKEETLLWPRTEELFSPPEQGQIVTAIISAIPPQDMPVLLPWIVDRLSPDDAEAYARALKAVQPEPVFRITAGWIRDRCRPEVWTQLRRRLPELITAAG